ncbi:hypothetical protein SAMN05192544_106048 [Paraburkholderia hospita]|jgi:hypothetical protein|uniref:hypothetical protein n=1 Tax=Paraburkholderia hospita TaxID=169430 RepID=UPI0008A79E71|nr:hypothetical protein SAMN05192544_106048 [Paraburkholderia hospita]
MAKPSNHRLLAYVFIFEWLVQEKETETIKKILRFVVHGTGVQGDHAAKRLLQYRGELADSRPI